MIQRLFGLEEIKEDTFGKRLSLAIKEKGLYQNELAFELKTSAASVSKWIHGIDKPSIEQLKDMALILGVTSDYLLGIGQKPFLY